jgi:hypothetical protein
MDQLIAGYQEKSFNVKVKLFVICVLFGESEVCIWVGIISTLSNPKHRNQRIILRCTDDDELLFALLEIPTSNIRATWQVVHFLKMLEHVSHA